MFRDCLWRKDFLPVRFRAVVLTPPMSLVLVEATTGDAAGSAEKASAMRGPPLESSWRATSDPSAAVDSIIVLVPIGTHQEVMIMIDFTHCVRRRGRNMNFT